MELNRHELVVVKSENLEAESDSNASGTLMNDVLAVEASSESAASSVSSEDGSTVIKELPSTSPEGQEASMNNNDCDGTLPTESSEETDPVGKSSCMSNEVGVDISSSADKSHCLVFESAGNNVEIPGEGPGTDGLDYTQLPMEEKVLVTMTETQGEFENETLIYEEKDETEEQFAVYLNAIKEETCSDEETGDCIEIRMEDDSGKSLTSPHWETSTVSEILEQNCQETKQQIFEAPPDPVETGSNPSLDSDVHPCLLIEKNISHNAENSQLKNSDQYTEGRVEDKNAELDTPAEKNQLRCTECGKEFSSQSELKKHIKRNIQIVTVKCIDCDKEVVFRNKCQISSHLRKHLEEKGKLTEAGSSSVRRKLPPNQRGYDCQACGVNFSSASRFERHVRNPTRNNVVPYWKCTSCDQKILVESRCKIYQHIMTHKKPMEVMKQRYPLIFNSYNEQSVSPRKEKTSGTIGQASPSSTVGPSDTPTIGGHHGGAPKADEKLESGCWLIFKKKYNCLVCTGLFKDRPTLEKHLVGNNSDCHPEFCCKQCGLILPSTCALIAHGKIHGDPATMQKPYMCPECGRCFRSSWTSFACHVLDECLHGNRVCVLHCPVCDKIVNQTTELTVHMESHIVEIWQCKLCSCSFTHKGLLIQHLQADHGEHKSKSTCSTVTTCHQCSEVLDTEALEKDHIAQHVNEAIRKAMFAFICYDCEQETLLETKEMLCSHKTRKHNYNHFCFLCKRQFASVTYFVKHLNKFHPAGSVGTSAEQDGDSTTAGDSADPNSECTVSVYESSEGTANAVIEIDVAGEAVCEENEDGADDSLVASSCSTRMEQPNVIKQGSLSSGDNIDASSEESQERNEIAAATVPQILVIKPSDFKKLVDPGNDFSPEILSTEKSVSVVASEPLAKQQEVSVLNGENIKAHPKAPKSTLVEILNRPIVQTDCHSGFETPEQGILPKGNPSNSEKPNNAAVKNTQENGSDFQKESGTMAHMIGSEAVQSSAQSNVPTIIKIVAKTPNTGTPGIGMLLPKRPIPILPKSMAPAATAILTIESSVEESIPLRKCICTNCKKEFMSAVALKQHMSAQEHTKSIPLYICGKCSMILPNKCALSLHEDMHSSIQKIPSACPECGLLFVNDESTFVRHVNRECFHQTRACCIKCSHCDKNFLASRFLDHFYREHVHKWNLTMDKCMFCRKKHYFLSLEMMTSHYEYHLNKLTMKDIIFKFFCAICKEKTIHVRLFSDVEALWEHVITIHGGLRTYSCTHCSLKFPLAESFNSHLAAYHPQSEAFGSEVGKKARDDCTEHEEPVIEIDTAETAPSTGETEDTVFETNYQKLPGEKVITIEPIIDVESMFEDAEEERISRSGHSEDAFLSNENLTPDLKSEQQLDEKADNQQLTRTVAKVCLSRVYDGKHYLCSICDQEKKCKKFVSPKNLLKHMQKCHPAELSPKKSKDKKQVHCIKEFTENKVKHHMRESPPCEESSNVDKSQKDRKPVQKSMSLSQRPVSPPLQNATKSLAQMSFCPPLQKASKSVEAHSCQFCGFTCISRAHMLFHVSECHSGFLPILFCPFCEERNIETAFGTLLMLRRHLSAKHMESDEETLRNSNDSNNSSNNNDNNSAIISITMPGHESSQSKHVKCRVCSTIFSRRGLLRKHLKQMHGIYTCVVCNNEYASEADFEEHKHQLQEPELQTKNDLGLSSEKNSVKGKKGRKKGYKRHKKATTDDNLGECQCRICKKIFTRPLACKRHELSEHDVYCCSFCQLWFDTKVELFEHMSGKHGDKVSQLQCQVCKSRGLLNFHTCKSFLDRHIRDRHRDIRAKYGKHLNEVVETEDVGVDSLFATPTDDVWKTPSSPSVKRLKLQKCIQKAHKHCRRSSSTDGKDGEEKEDVQPSLSNAVIKTASPPPVKRLRVEGDTVYTCAKCSLVTDDAAKFADHIKEHNTDQASQCPDCGLCFTILPALKKHLFMVHKIRDSDKYLQDKGMKTEEDEVDFDAMIHPYLMMTT